MKTGKAAKVFGLDPKTITNWTDNALLSKFFSRDALGEVGASQRDYNEADILVLNTIRLERSRGADWLQIAELLETGVRDKDLPPTAMMVETTMPIAQFGKIATLITERDNLKSEVERLNQELEKRDTTIDRQQHRIEELNRQIGRLEGRLEQIKEDLDD
jgi:DNA-binding transcriptional MerR regulator